MKNKLTVVFLLILLSIVPVKAEEVIWAPIMMGDITFFVPLGEVPPSQPPSTPPEPPAPVITDGNLQACIDYSKQQKGWVNDSEVTELYCAGWNIVDVTGIDALGNLDRLALGNNYISDVSAIARLNNLTWLHLASYNFTNEIFNDDLSILSGMSNLKSLTVNNAYAEPLVFENSGFNTGFNGITTNSTGGFSNETHLEFIVETGYIKTSLQCLFTGSIFTKWPMTVFQPDASCTAPPAP